MLAEARRGRRKDKQKEAGKVEKKEGCDRCTNEARAETKGEK